MRKKHRLMKLNTYQSVLFPCNLCSILLKESDVSCLIRKVYLNLCPKIGNNYPFA